MYINIGYYYVRYKKNYQLKSMHLVKHIVVSEINQTVKLYS